MRLHDLWYTFGSRALALGEPLPMIGRLLGHTKIQTTARYAQFARDPVRDLCGPRRRQYRRRHPAAREAEVAARLRRR